MDLCAAEHRVVKSSELAFAWGTHARSGVVPFGGMLVRWGDCARCGSTIIYVVRRADEAGL